MRRRLTLALVGIALASIAFVGLGVLLLAQIGAREAAIDVMSEQLTALAELDFTAGRGPADLGRLRQALEFEQLEFVAVRSDGHVQLIRPNRVNPTNRSALTDQISLNAGQLSDLQSGRQVFINLEGSVVGVQTIDLALPRDDFQAALIAQASVAPIASAARGWFVLSAAGVLVVAALMGSWLAKRFTQPIASIEAATRSIAAGDLSTRVEITGSDEMAQLGESVNAMAAELHRSRQLEQQFLMSVSHDLRTPLTAIEGYAEALTDGAVEDVVHTGEVISNHAGRLDRLVRDLLDLARLQARQFRMELRPIDPAVAVGRTIAGMSTEAEARGVSLSSDLTKGTSVMADPDRLSQIVANLVENAIKYAETTIEVSLVPFVTDSGKSVARLTVTDDGPGINPEDLPRVFERLYVTQQKPKRAEASSGLGLAIVNELTRAMGGSVAVFSQLGSGTRMVVELPTD